MRYRLRVLESQSRRARRDMPLPRPSRGTSRHRITLSGARRAAGGFAGEFDETRHGSLLRETSRARSWRDSFQG